MVENPLFMRFSGFFIFQVVLYLWGCTSDSLRSQVSYTPIWWKTLYSCGFPAFSFFKLFFICGVAHPIACAPNCANAPCFLILIQSQDKFNTFFKFPPILLQVNNFRTIINQHSPAVILHKVDNIGHHAVGMSGFV